MLLRWDLTQIACVWALYSWVLFRISKAADYTGFLTSEDFLRARNLESQDDGTFLTADDFKRGGQLAQNDLYEQGRFSRDRAQGQKYHGDIVGKAAWTFQKNGVRRNGVRLPYDKWPNGNIPYTISNRYSQRERAILARAMQAYHDRTCIKFTPRVGNEPDYIYIGKIDGCFSDVGKAGGRQEVSLDDGCVEYDTAIHELMHAVGFWHEHERWDRDDFISILWQNIDRDAYDQFGRVNLFESSYYDEKYDYYSIMHYDRKSFSKNGQDTMQAKDQQYTSIIGRVQDFSPVDLRKINKMYSCPQLVQPTYTQAPVVQPVFTPAPVVQPVFTQAPVIQPWTSWPQPQPPQTGEVCADRATLCWRWVSRCRSPFFEQVMRQFCAQTCGFCNSGASAVNTFNTGRRRRRRIRRNL